MINLGTFSVGTLLGIVLGTFLGHALANRRTDRQIFNIAALEFKKAFIPFSQRIDFGEEEITIVEDTFISHDLAMRSFALHLEGLQLTGFYDTWGEYQKWHNVRCNIGTTTELFPEEKKEYMELKGASVKPIIDKLLKFAEVKEFCCIKKT